VVGVGVGATAAAAAAAAAAASPTDEARVNDGEGEDEEDVKGNSGSCAAADHDDARRSDSGDWLPLPLLPLLTPSLERFTTRPPTKLPPALRCRCSSCCCCCCLLNDSGADDGDEAEALALCEPCCVWEGRRTLPALLGRPTTVCLGCAGDDGGDDSGDDGNNPPPI
jgi:hypothetical protein